MLGERIGFLTDYGVEDAFVAICHGVMGRIAPAARIIDITHAVPPQDVRRGAEVLARAAPYIAPGVFVAVVDPGVGTDRRPIAVAAGSAVLVGPDNGLLMGAADALGGAGGARVLTNRELFREPVSETFHGRDIFAPVAAHLARGVPLDRVGPAVAVTDLVRLPEPRLRTADGVVAAEVLMVDRFGNVQLAADADALRRAGLDRAATLVVGAAGGAAVRMPRAARFADAAPGSPLLLTDSDGRLAVAVNRGRADLLLGVGPGDVVEVAASDSVGDASAKAPTAHDGTAGDAADGGSADDRSAASGDRVPADDDARGGPPGGPSPDDRPEEG